MGSKSKSSTEFLWEVLSRSLGFEGSDHALKREDDAPVPPCLRTREKIVQAQLQAEKPNPATARPRNLSNAASPPKKSQQRSASSRTRSRPSTAKRSRRSTKKSRRSGSQASSKGSAAKTGSRTGIKVHFSTSSECVLSPGIIRHGFTKPSRREQRRLRRLAERSRLYLLKHGKSLPDEYLDRTPTSLVSELDRKERERKISRRMRQSCRSTTQSSFPGVVGPRLIDAGGGGNNNSGGGGGGARGIQGASRLSMSEDI